MADRQGDAPAVAIPYADFTEATNAVIADLERRGLGRWVLRPHTPVDEPNGRPTVPIVMPDGSLLAVLKALEVPQDAPDAPDPGADAVTTMGRLLGSIAAAEQRAEQAARKAARAEAASMADGLTGLPNHRAWQLTMVREAERCRRTGTKAVIAVIDLDDLKTVNDTYGHLAGDLLLRTAAEAIRTTIRRTDTVARVGGDEFAVLAVDYDEAMVQALVERITAALAADDISASIGATLHAPAVAIEDSFHLADEAMYETKRQRKAGGSAGT